MRLHSISIHHEYTKARTRKALERELREFMAFHKCRISLAVQDGRGGWYVWAGHGPVITPTYYPEQRFLH